MERHFTEAEIFSAEAKDLLNDCKSLKGREDVPCIPYPLQ